MLNTNNLVSVIMSTYNEPVEWVAKAVDSILSQTYSNIELIVVVDNPNNYSVIDYLESLKNPKIILLENKKNMGLVYSLNKAIGYSKGAYIARMDADDISHPNRIEKQLEYMTQYDIDLCGTQFKCFNEKGIKYVSKLCCTNKYITRHLRYIGNGTAHPTWLVKRDVFIKLQGYRAIEACEDYDFLIRASLRGYVIGNVNEILFYYRDNENSICHTKELIQISTSYLLGKEYRHRCELDFQKYLKLCKTNEIYIGNLKFRVYMFIRKMLYKAFYVEEKLFG